MTIGLGYYARNASTESKAPVNGVLRRYPRGPPRPFFSCSLSFSPLWRLTLHAPAALHPVKGPFDRFPRPLCEGASVLTPPNVCLRAQHFFEHG